VSAVTNTEVFAFAGFSLDPRQRLLFGPDGTTVPLTARAFDTLLFLVEHPNQLIEKQTLMKALWPNVIVEENNLNQNISAVRKALGETPGEHRFVVTVPGRGFRFVPSVSTVAPPPPTAQVMPPPVPPAAAPQAAAPPAAAPAAPAPAPALPAMVRALRASISRTPLWWAASGATLLVLLLGVLLWVSTHKAHTVRAADDAPQEASVAVLPFVNLTGDSAKEYFSDGMAEELINELTRMRGLKVPARTSTFAYKGKNVDVRQIGRELSVATVLEGSVQSAGERIRVTAQLVNARTGFQLWAQSYDRKFGDVFMLEDEISAQIAEALRANVHAELPSGGAYTRPTRDPEAFRLFLQANAARDSDAAIHLYSDAIERDPGFARAYAGRAVRRIRSISYGTVIVGAVADAERDATRAIALDPNIGAAHVALGAVNAVHGDWLAAESSLTKSLQLSPYDSLGHREYAVLVLDTVGHLRHSLEEARRAYELNPAGVVEISVLAAVYNLLGQEEDALKYANLATELGARDSGAGILTAAIRGTVAARKGEYNDVVLQSLSSAMRTPEATATVKRVFGAFARPAERPAAVKALRQLAQQLDSLGPAQRQREPLVIWPVLLGDLDLAFQSANHWIDEDSKQGSVGISWGFLWMPEMRAFRADPRFQALAGRLKLFDYWRQYGPPDGCDVKGGRLECR
jgi:TolB-like protein/DNA-binding winged helix-turn-helix (wHTH) protein